MPDAAAVLPSLPPLRPLPMCRSKLSVFSAWLLVGLDGNALAFDDEWLMLWFAGAVEELLWETPRSDFLLLFDRLEWAEAPPPPMAERDCVTKC